MNSYEAVLQLVRVIEAGELGGLGLCIVFSWAGWWAVLQICWALHRWPLSVARRAATCNTVLRGRCTGTEDVQITLSNGEEFVRTFAPVSVISIVSQWLLFVNQASDLFQCRSERRTNLRYRPLDVLQVSNMISGSTRIKECAPYGPMQN